MFWLSPDAYTLVALCELDLDPSSIAGLSIVVWPASTQELEREHVRSDHLSNTTDEMTVGGEFTVRKECFETIDDGVEIGEMYDVPPWQGRA